MINHAAIRLAARFGLGSVLAVAGAGMMGCGHDDKPHEYGQERPSINDLDSRDKGLQSKDINQAADQMAADLLALPELNASKELWTIVIGKMEDNTRGRDFATNYDIFLQAVKVRIGKMGRGRVQLITNRDRFRKMRSDELESGQAITPEAINPDYTLTGVVNDLPRQGTTYYQIEFSLENMRNRTTPWVNQYAVKVAR